jgi:sec-independent protein translocase protein TatA
MVTVCMNSMFAAMLGGWEIVLILAVVLILFGAKRLPELAKGLGSGIKEFKKATRDVTDEISSAMDDNPPPPRRLSQSSDSTPSAPRTETHSIPQSSPQPKV